jgi:hypothetical protein
LAVQLGFVVSGRFGDKRQLAVWGVHPVVAGVQDDHVAVVADLPLAGGIYKALGQGTRKR